MTDTAAGLSADRPSTDPALDFFAMRRSLAH